MAATSDSDMTTSALSEKSTSDKSVLEKPSPEKSASEKPDPELDRLKREAEISKQRAEIAANKAKQVQSQLPSQVKAPEGTTNVVGDHPIESQILAYDALNKLAESIAGRVASRNPAAVVIYSEAEINALVALQAFAAQLDLIATQLTAEIDNAKTAIANAKAAVKPAHTAKLAAALELAPMVVGGALRSAADLLSIFRADVTLRYKDLTIGDIPLVAAVAGHLASRQQPVTVYHPALVPPGLSSADSAISGKLRELAGSRGEIEDQQQELARLDGTLKAQIEALTSEIAASDAAVPAKDTSLKEKSRDGKQTALEELTAVVTRLAAATASFDAFEATLFKADESSGTSVMARLLRAEKLRSVGANAHWLLVRIAVAGGGYKTKRWLWWPTTKVLYSGGAIAEFVLFDASGRIVEAGVSPNYSGFIQVKERLCKTELP